jgi:hypothetical protein
VDCNETTDRVHNVVDDTTPTHGARPLAKEPEKTAILHCRMKPEDLALMDQLAGWLNVDTRSTLVRKLVREAHTKERRRREKSGESVE